MTFSRDHNYRALEAIVAEGTSQIVVWAGAGLSVDAGLPNWVGLRKLLMEAGAEKARELEPDDCASLEGELAAISRQSDPWVAFERLKSALGSTTFTTVVRSALSASADVDIPVAYELVWRLGAKAILTLNLDNLASRAHASVHGGRKGLWSSDGRRVSLLDSYTQRTNDVVANLHGNVEDASSWVLTREDLKELSRHGAYTDFVRRTIQGYTNIFLGMSADDAAVAGHLEAIRAKGIELGECFWFSNRRDTHTDTWAEAAGMRLIRYNADPGHSAVVIEFLEELIAARPAPESAPAPVLPSFEGTGAFDLPVEALPPAGELAALPAEVVRLHLNTEAKRILSRPGLLSKDEYDRFCADYEEAIYRAWYVSTSPGANSLMGYRIEEEVAAGAFGRVFRAVDPKGAQVAVKLLRHEIRSKRELLESFRRGVRSMEILSSRGVQSMVQYKGATEIPSMVVMDWVDGPNLGEAKESGFVEDWASILRICVDLTAVILSAHQVPERVLHRDLRPANVMLRGYWTDADNFEVVVLDFDLSWYQGAENRSVQYSTAMGYLAPEQRGVVTGSTRHAAVDVYGLGMTFWHLLTGRDPVPDQHLHADFRTLVLQAADRIPGTEWRSLSRRFADLVCWMTENLQDQRPDMARVLGELTALQSASDGLGVHVPLELRVEELAAQTDYFAGYRHDVDGNAFIAPDRRGIEAILGVGLTSNDVQLELRWARTGVEERRGLNKYAQRAESGVRSRLTASGWKVHANRHAGQSFDIFAVRPNVEAAEVRAVAADLDDALRQVRFN